MFLDTFSELYAESNCRSKIQYELFTNFKATLHETFQCQKFKRNYVRITGNIFQNYIYT